MNLLYNFEIAGINFYLLFKGKYSDSNLAVSLNNDPHDFTIAKNPIIIELHGDQDIPRNDQWNRVIRLKDRLILYGKRGWRAEIDHDYQTTTLFQTDGIHEERLPTHIRHHPLIHFLLSHLMPLRGGLLIHAAGVIIDGCGLIFAGVSGAGKSTLLNRIVTEPAITALSEEKITARINDQDFIIQGAPGRGEFLSNLKRQAPLKAILFLSRGEDGIQALTPKQALDKLLPATFLPTDDHALFFKTLEICERLLTVTPAFKLRFHLNGGPDEMIKTFVSTI